MLPAERRKNHVADPGKGFPPAVTVSPQPKSLRMERGYGKLDFRSFAGVSCCANSNCVAHHRVGILTAVQMRHATDHQTLTLMSHKPMIRREVTTDLRCVL